MKYTPYLMALVLALAGCDRERTPAERSEANADKKAEEVRETVHASTDKLSWKGNWNVLRGKLKQKYGQLTDDDLTYQEGKEDEMIGRLQKKLGKTRAEIEDMLNGS